MWDYGIGSMLNGLMTLIAVFGIGLLSCGIFLIVHFTTVNHKQFKTTTPPVITWELKAHGQKVDTVWVYKFK